MARLVPAIVLAFALPALAFGQWLNYPTAGVPKTPSGLPNLSAPTPRTADGKPDFSGLWEIENTGGCPPYGCADLPLSKEFLNIGARLPGGLPYQPWAAELVKKRMADNGKDDPASQCQPAGAIRLFTFPQYRKMVQVPGLLVMLSERDVTFRQIFTDGRELPKDPQPSFHRVLVRPLGRRHVSSSDQRLPRWDVAGPQRQSDDGRRETNRAIPARRTTGPWRSKLRWTIPKPTPRPGP